MPSGFGYFVPGTQGTPDPRQVGAQLMQSQQQQAAQPIGVAQAPPVPPHVRDAMLRREGGRLMGAGGPDEDGAMAAAVGEALTRRGGGHTPNPNPNKNRAAHVRHLQQLGISELEATLLGETL